MKKVYFIVKDLMKIVVKQHMEITIKNYLETFNLQIMIKYSK